MKTKNITFSMASNNLDLFLQYLQKQGYRELTQKIMINNVRYFLKSEEDESKMFTEETIYMFVNSHYDKKKQHSRYNSVLGTCLRFYSFLSKGDFSDALIKNYPPNMSYELGIQANIYIEKQFSRISNQTLKCKQRTIWKFINFLSESGIDDPLNIDSPIVLTYLNDKTPETASIIRAFLSYLFENKKLKWDMSVLISISHRPKKLPTVYNEHQLQLLIDTFDGDNLILKRNKAILLLAATTGIRSCDIVNLKYSDFCFDNNTVSFVQMKTGVPLTLSITTNLAELIKDYYKHRPKSKTESLFLNQNAPFNSISTGIIRYILKKAFSSANIDITGKKHGPHALRSSLASAMINSGMSYEIVQKQLGHTSEESLRSYVRFDIEKLRLCALETQPATGNFKYWLEGHV